MEEITCAANMESANILRMYKPMKPAYHTTKRILLGWLKLLCNRKNNCYVETKLYKKSSHFSDSNMIKRTCSGCQKHTIGNKFLPGTQF